jgi:hypothetical protein
VERTRLTRTLVAAAAVAAVLGVAPARAASGADGNTSYAPNSQYPSSLLPQASAQTTPTTGGTGNSGGATYHAHLLDRTKRRQRRRKLRDHPVLASFQVSRTSIFAYGRPATISYQINDRSPYVRVRLAFLRTDDPHAIYRFNLGRKRTGAPHTFRWRGISENEPATQGSYRFRITARDPEGNRLVRSSEAVGGTPLEFRSHRFPVDGPHTFGGPDARFGAPRPGHTHQGQDILADEGTPLVAPRAGLITWRAYQAEGAGYYLVLAAEGEPYNYVFMHLQGGSILVKQGDRVKTGQMLARVGSTGTSSGPHLHFEIWDGPWFNGGKPIDPLPMLKSWEA